jgi:hypothetical protein
MEAHMPIRKVYSIIPIGLGLFLLASLIALWPTPKVDAQCGSQASSCKNCHETQGKKPVNNDGTGWHQSHAFGDFCYICHAGNNQSMDEATAHTGMVPPLSDTKASCAGCHPDDLAARVKVYADILGVTPDTGGGGSGTITATQAVTTTAGAATTGNNSSSSTQPASPPGLVVDDSQVIDYNLRYAGVTPVNWGNILLVVFIVVIALGGGTFIYFNERKLRGWAKPASVRKIAAQTLPQVEGFSPEVVALLPKIAQLNPVGLHALQRLLENPEDASAMLHSLSHMDPELVRRIRSLDRDSRALLFALAGD